jgi:hypothetical protein
MEVLIFETSHPTSSETVLMYINFTSCYEHMLCAAKQPLYVADAAEGLTCNRQCRATWEGWMKRNNSTDFGEQKMQTWKKMGGTAIRLWTWPRSLYHNKRRRRERLLTWDSFRSIQSLKLVSYITWNCRVFGLCIVQYSRKLENWWGGGDMCSAGPIRKSSF